MTYTAGLVPNDQVKVRLRVDGPGWDGVFFDDIALTPVSSVLLSTNVADINIRSSVVDNTSVPETTGFYYSIWRDDAFQHVRLRIGTNNGSSVLIRELYDAAGGFWDQTLSSRMGEGVYSLRFDYDENTLLTNGKDTEVKMMLGFQTESEKDQGLAPSVEQTSVYSMAR